MGSTRPLTVLQLINNLDIGGAQEVVRTLAAYLPEADCQLVVCSFKDGPLRQAIELLGVPVEIIPVRQYTVLAFPGFLRDMWRIYRTLAHLVSKYKVTIIQTHLLRSLDFLVLLLRFHAQAPLVFWTIHNSEFELRAHHLKAHHWLLKPKQQVYHWLYRLCGRWVNGFIAVSADVKTALLHQGGLAEHKITVICNGVDLYRYDRQADRGRVRQALGLSESAQLLIMVATCKGQKGHRYLLSALASLAPEWPQMQVLLVGDGELRSELEAHAWALGLSQQVHFLGNRQDVPELLGASDYFVLPSLWEGLPMALIEAMASGLPIVTSDVSGTRQVMVAGETGLMVPSGDVDRLREAILTLLRHPQQAKAMGAAARQRVSADFSAHKQAREHARLYRQGPYHDNL